MSMPTCHCHESWYNNLGWYGLLKSKWWCCSCSLFLLYSLARVCTLGKTGQQLNLGNTSWTIKYIPVQYHWLGKYWHEAFPIWWQIFCLRFPLPIIDFGSIKETGIIIGYVAWCTGNFSPHVFLICKWVISLTMVHNIPASIGILTFSMNEFFRTFSFLIL